MTRVSVRYAEGTQVSVEKSKMELDTLLGKHGATQRMIGVDEDQGRAIVLFTLDGRQVRFEMRLPSLARYLIPDSPPRGWDSWTEERQYQWARKQHEQAQRQKWRAILLVTKAKLELVADGMSTVEREFLSDIVLPDGRRVEQLLAPALEQAYLSGEMPPLLPEWSGE